MATVAGVRTDGFTEGVFETWTPLTTANAGGSAATFVGAGDRTVQVTGTFGAGGTVIIEGSLDGSTWFGLRDPTSTAISFTAAGLKAILEAVPYIRPRVTAGDGTTSITVKIYHRRNNNA
jgi:hypothetical protein